MQSSPHIEYLKPFCVKNPRTYYENNASVKDVVDIFDIFKGKLKSISNHFPM